MQSNTLLLLANAEPATMGGRLEEAAMLALVGMGIVFFGLILLNLLLSALNKMPRTQAIAAGLQPAGTAISPALIGDTDVDAETLAVLTAAAIAAVGRPLRVKAVRIAGFEQSHAWAEHGRAAIHTSHRLRKGSR